jgi:hypothetical protein
MRPQHDRVERMARRRWARQPRARRAHAVWLVAALLAWPIAMSSRIDGSPGLVVSRDQSISAVGCCATCRADRRTGVGAAAAWRRLPPNPARSSTTSAGWSRSPPHTVPCALDAAVRRPHRWPRATVPPEPTASARFQAYSLRFLRLGVMMAVVYAVAFRAVGQWPGVLAAVLARTTGVRTPVRAVVETGAACWARCAPAPHSSGDTG